MFEEEESHVCIAHIATLQDAKINNAHSFEYFLSNSF